MEKLIAVLALSLMACATHSITEYCISDNVDNTNIQTEMTTMRRFADTENFHNAQVYGHDIPVTELESLHNVGGDIHFEEINASIESINSQNKIMENTYIEYEIPDYNTNFKSYMGYKAITNTRSAQYKLQQSAWTDENGLRRIGDDYMVAMGTYYSSTIGDRFKITLDNGTEFTVIIGDVKADRHTDEKNQYRAVYDERGRFISANVLEFIVDTPYLPRKVRQMGTVSAIDDFDGNIESIEKIVEE